MFPSASSNLKSFQSLKLFCAIVLIYTQLVAGNGGTDQSYNDLILAPRRRYDDFPSSSSIVEKCTSGLPCHILDSSIRTMRALLNELEIASEQHCQRPDGSEIKSSMQPSRRVNDHLQRLRNQKPPLRRSSKIRNIGQSVSRLRHDEGARFSRRHLLRVLPLEPYQQEPNSFHPTGQAYTITPREIRNLNQTLQRPIVAGKLAVKKSKNHDDPSSSVMIDTDSKRTKMKKKKFCSRRSGKKNIEPKLDVQKDAIIEKSSNVSTDISGEATSPKNETEPGTTPFFVADKIDSETDRSDES